MPQHTSTTDITTGVLTRYLPSLTSIVETASFATIYHGQTSALGAFEWTRANIEGTLFLCESPRHEFHIIVLNRKGVNNFIFTLPESEEIEFMDEGVHIVLPSTGEEGVLCYGVWVYSPEGMSTQGDRERIGAAIMKCVRKKRDGKKEGGGDVLGQLFENVRLQIRAGQ